MSRKSLCFFTFFKSSEKNCNRGKGRSSWQWAMGGTEGTSPQPKRTKTPPVCTVSYIDNNATKAYNIHKSCNNSIFKRRKWLWKKGKPGWITSAG